MPTQILIVDDDTSIRRLLRRLLEEHPDWQVCGEAANGVEALSKITELCPDIVVMDLAMPQMNGLQAAREVSRLRPALPMLLLTVQEISNELVRQARMAGFKGAVSKSTGGEVIRGLETLLRQQSFFVTNPFDLAS